MATAEKSSQQFQDEAAALLKANAARVAVEAAAKSIERDKAALAALEAARDELPDDDETISRHATGEAVLKIKVGKAEKKLTGLRGELAAVEGEADRASRLVAYRRAKELQDDLRQRYAAEFSKPAQTILAYFRSTVAAMMEARAVNQRLPEGEPHLVNWAFLERDVPVAHVRVEVLDSTGGVIWSGLEDRGPGASR